MLAGERAARGPGPFRCDRSGGAACRPGCRGRPGRSWAPSRPWAPARHGWVRSNGRARARLHDLRTRSRGGCARRCAGRVRSGLPEALAGKISGIGRRTRARAAFPPAARKLEGPSVVSSAHEDRLPRHRSTHGVLLVRRLLREQHHRAQRRLHPSIPTARTRACVATDSAWTRSVVAERPTRARPAGPAARLRRRQTPAHPPSISEACLPRRACAGTRPRTVPPARRAAPPPSAGPANAAPSPAGQAPRAAPVTSSRATSTRATGASAERRARSSIPSTRAAQAIRR